MFILSIIMFVCTSVQITFWWHTRTCWSFTCSTSHQLGFPFVILATLLIIIVERCETFFVLNLWNIFYFTTDWHVKTTKKLFACWLSQGGSLHGKYMDATPFREAGREEESKPNSLVDELGVMLREKGFNYHGSEVMYSGIYGTELRCEIFIGPCYYQRLRHMVSDKFQVWTFPTLKVCIMNGIFLWLISGMQDTKHYVRHY